MRAEDIHNPGDWVLLRRDQPLGLAMATLGSNTLDHFTVGVVSVNLTDSAQPVYEVRLLHRSPRMETRDNGTYTVLDCDIKERLLEARGPRMTIDQFDVLENSRPENQHNILRSHPGRIETTPEHRPGVRGRVLDL